MGHGCKNRRNGRKRRNSTRDCAPCCKVPTTQSTTCQTEDRVPNPLSQSKDVKQCKKSSTIASNYTQQRASVDQTECCKVQGCPEAHRKSSVDIEKWKKWVAQTRYSHTQGQTGLTTTPDTWTGKEGSQSDDKSCSEIKKPNYAAVVKVNLRESSISGHISYPLKPYTGQQLVIIYTLTYRSVSFPCLKCRTEQSGVAEENKPKVPVFFQHEELIVRSGTEKECIGRGLPVCTVFDNDFVERNKKLFIPYWNNILKYVTEDKHIIDMHGLTGPIAKAATEFAIARESQYAKDLHGNADGVYKTLEVITGRGSHSNGPAVLPFVIEEHLKAFGFTNIKKSAQNPGLLGVDIRNIKRNILSTDILQLNFRSE